MTVDQNLEPIFESVLDAHELTAETLGSLGKRKCSIVDVPETPRDIFLAFDVLATTCKSGLGAWIYHHIDEEGWVDAAKKSFERLGHPQAAADIESARQLYRLDPQWSRTDQWHALDDYLIDHEDKIVLAIHYLLANAEI